MTVKQHHFSLLSSWFNCLLALNELLNWETQASLPKHSPFLFALSGPIHDTLLAVGDCVYWDPRCSCSRDEEAWGRGWVEVGRLASKHCGVSFSFWQSLSLSLKKIRTDLAGCEKHSPRGVRRPTAYRDLPWPSILPTKISLWRVRASLWIQTPPGCIQPGVN